MTDFCCCCYSAIMLLLFIALLTLLTCYISYLFKSHGSKERTGVGGGLLSPAFQRDAEWFLAWCKFVLIFCDWCCVSNENSVSEPALESRQADNMLVLLAAKYKQAAVLYENVKLHPPLCAMTRLHWDSPDVTDAWIPLSWSLSWRKSQNILAGERWKKALRVTSYTVLSPEAIMNSLLCLFVSENLETTPTVKCHRAYV